MAAVTTAQPINLPADLRIVKLKVVCDAAYPTGGYDLTAALTPANGVTANAVFGIAQVRHLAAAQLVAVYRADTNKVSLFESTTGAPAALVEVAASSAHVTTSTIIDVILFVTSSPGTTA
jgi:hypothetical protein